MLIKESVSLTVENPIFNPQEAKEAAGAQVQDFKLTEVRAIYPMIKAINSGRLTRNFTYYPRETLVGKASSESPRGYHSFVHPYGKPILTEHRASDDWFQADAPMGRVIAAGYMRADKNATKTPCSKSYMPGTVEGDGYLWLLPAITDSEAITKILGNTYNTVSIGSRVDSVIESISGQDLVKLRQEGKDLPAYSRGQVYEGKLSYWMMVGLDAMECSYVNTPSDVRAGTMDPDLGYAKVRLLLGDKKMGSKEFSFYDLKTKERVTLDANEMTMDYTFCEDSLPSPREYFITAPLLDLGTMQESAQIEPGCEVSWGLASGKVLSIHELGKVPGVLISVEASPTNKFARIQVYKNGEPTEMFVAHAIKNLKRIN